MRCVLVLTDEAALVKGARNLGYVFSSRTPDAVTIDVVSELIDVVINKTF